MKKILAFIICLAMIFTLAACSSSSKSQEVEATPAPEFVYKATFTPLAYNTRVNYVPAYYTDDGIYVTGYDIVGSSAPEGVEEEYFGQYDIRENRIFYVDYSGNMKKLENYVPVPSIEAEEGQYDFICSSYLTGVSLNSRGNLAVMETQYCSWNDIDGLSWEDNDYYESYHFTERMYFRELSPDGTEIGCTEYIPEGDDTIYSECVLDNDGNFLATKYASSNGTYSILGIGTDGNVAYEIPIDNYAESFFKLSDDTIYVVSWSDGLQMKELDIENKKLLDGYSIPGDAYTIYTGGGDYDIYYTSGNSFYGMNVGDEEAEKLFSWIDCDVNAIDVPKVGIMSDGTIRTLLLDFDSSDMVYNIDLASIKKEAYDPNTSKKELTLATQYLSDDLREAVISFNRKSEDTRIIIKDYSEFNTEEDYSAGTTKMTTEIIAGNLPDIIDLNGMPATQFASKGILEDLYPYLDADSELSRDDYFENVLAAAENDGKLVHTVSYFYLQTVVGAASLVGDLPGWDYDEFNAALSLLQADVEDATAFDIYTTRSEILPILLSLDMRDFVNWSTGKVDFNNNEFIELLKFVKEFPTEYNWDDYQWETDSTENRLSQGKQMLYRESISSTDTLMYLESCFKGTPITFIGYPTYNGVGNTIGVDSGLAITTTCKDKQAAWDFIKTLMTAKTYENSYRYYGLPAIKSVFDKQIKSATTIQYKIGNDGQYELDSDGNRIPQERYFANNSDLYSYYSLSEDVAQAFRDAIDSCDRVYDMDESIISIVSEEAEAFFSDQKSAEDVAKLVQSKVFIYVNE